MRRVARSTGVRIVLATILGLVSLTSLPWTPSVRAAVTAIPAGDIAALIAAINAANANPDADEISLADNATYTLTEYDNILVGDNGLPVISTSITITGNGATITRADDALAFRIMAVTGTLALNNLTISNGSISNGSKTYGGAILNNGGTVTLTNSTIIGNHASSAGGGIVNFGGNVTLTDSTISGNDSDHEGGGISSYYGSTVTVINSTISGNNAAYGGGVYTANGTVNLTNSTVSGNDAVYSGGGIYSHFGTLSMIETTISGNYAEDGGGIESSGSMNLTDSTVRGNEAYFGGGIDNSGTMNLTNSTINGNIGVSGGGIVNYGTLNLTNSTISGNEASNGGGLYSFSGTVTVTNSTISSNIADSRGGGIYTYPRPVTLANTIVAANAAPLEGPDVYGSVASSDGHNLIGNDYGMDGLTNGGNGNQIGTVAAPIDPLLGTLANNGGPTQTMLLLDGSPAISAGNDTVAPTTDQRGIDRPLGAASDIGAVEVEGEIASDDSPPLIVPTVTGTIGDNDWFTSDVTVSWSVTDSESNITSTNGCDETVVTSDTAGTTLTCTATSEGGTASELVTIKRDATAPTLAPTVSPNPVAVNESSTATSNATEATSGVASESCDPVDTSSIGPGSVTCTATDLAGNTSTADASYTVVNPDSTAPVITPSVIGTIGTNDWYTSDVSVSWTVTDSESDIVSSDGCGDSTITSDTAGTTLTCTATSGGGTESQSVTIKRDATTPVVTYTGNRGRYGLLDTIAITCSASDATSGLASTTCANIGGSPQSFGAGLHRFTATATDLAGNTASGTTEFTVATSHGDMCTLTRQLSSNAQIARMACFTLMLARRAEVGGQDAYAEQLLASYRTQIERAVTRRYITAAAGAFLIEWSHTL